MPLYQQIIMALPKAPKDVLVKLFRNHTKTVLDHGGNVRGIENHGVKPLKKKKKRYVVMILFLLNILFTIPKR